MDKILKRDSKTLSLGDSPKAGFDYALNASFIADCGKALKILIGDTGIVMSFAKDLDAVFIKPQKKMELETFFDDVKIAVMPMRIF